MVLAQPPAGWVGMGGGKGPVCPEGLPRALCWGEARAGGENNLELDGKASQYAALEQSRPATPVAHIHTWPATCLTGSPEVPPFRCPGLEDP